MFIDTDLTFIRPALTGSCTRSRAAGLSDVKEMFAQMKDHATFAGTSRRGHWLNQPVPRLPAVIDPGTPEGFEGVCVGRLGLRIQWVRPLCKCTRKFSIGIWWMICGLRRPLERGF